MTFQAVSVQQQRVADYVGRWQQLGSFTLAQLATEYGVTKFTARQIVRDADATLAARHLATSVPNRASGWRQLVTGNVRAYGASIRERLHAIGKELARYERSLTALGADQAVLTAISDIRVQVDTFAEALANPGAATPGP